MRRVGIFPGSFDPPLKCHLNLAETVLNQYALDEIIFAPIVAGRGETKDTTGYADRVCMCIASTVGKQNMRVMSRETPSGLLPTLKWLRKSCADARLFCVMDVGLFSGAMDKLAGKNACRDIVFICPGKIGDDTGMVRQNAAACGLDMEMLPCCSLDEAESDARHTVFSMRDPDSMPAGALKICALKGLYIQNHYQDIKNGMSEHRWQHTLGVRRSAVALAEKYGGSLIKCAVAAFYHDCAKDMNPKDMRKILLDHGADIHDETLQSGAMMHGPAGAILAEERYHVYDREVLDAIRYHTTGREEMTLTDLIIFVADAIEPNRQDYPGLNAIRSLAEIDLYAAALYSLYATRDYVAERGKIFHLAGQKTIAALEERLRNDRRLDPAAAELLREKSSFFH